MWPLLTLAFGAFVAQTTEYLPIGLLPQIGDAFQVSDGPVGALVTGYAWIAALTAVPLTLASQHVGRRRLFLGLLGLVTLANALAALAPSYAALALFRLIVALTHGVFWSILASFGARVAPTLSPGRATAWVFTGISGAVVAGVPLATAIGQAAGWRAAFAVFAGLGALAVTGGWFLLPPLPGLSNRTGPRLPQHNRLIYGAAGLTGLSLTAHFCSYTYVVPLMKSVARVPEAHLPPLLFVFGVAGIAGNALGGLLSKRVTDAIALAIASIVGAQMIMVLAGGAAGFAWGEMILWGVGISLLIVGLQSWILEIAPDQADAASALYVAAFNAGIGSGALVGGVVLEHGGPGWVLASGVMLGSASLLGLTLLTLRFKSRRRRQSQHPPHPCPH